MKGAEIVSNWIINSAYTALAHLKTMSGHKLIHFAQFRTAITCEQYYEFIIAFKLLYAVLYDELFYNFKSFYLSHCKCSPICDLL